MTVDEISDRLYALPPEEFTQARNQAERDLRAAGERDQADQVKALRKPTAGAGAVNRLVHGHRAEVEAFLEVAAKLRDAQFAGKGELAEAAEAERVALEKLVALGGEPVRATLQAAAVDDDIAENLLAARFVREPEPAGFGTLLAYADPKAARTLAGKRPAKPQPKASVARNRRRLDEAKRTLKAATAEERQVRRRLQQTQRELEQAQAAVENAQRELDRLRSR